MYEISVEQEFEAAHYLRGYRGKCEKMHGHHFRVVAKLRAGKLDRIGIAYDFTMLKSQLGQILARFDHTCLNEVAPFDKINPTSENVAATVYRELQAVIEAKGVVLSSVQVWESPRSCVTYFLDDD
ncbi:MAG: 6-carboxytetrahydropterin synthase QueD [Dehalococcoidia bacterium]|nr:6-carboxytetrahydropterin synthase QueD [Dehalococcoidia bacterium]